MDETVFQSEDDRQSAQEASSSGKAPELEGYKFSELLGMGTFGEVWRATHDRTGQDVAVKMLRRDSGLDWRYLESELSRLRALGEHPNIVTLLDADLTCETPYFVMPHLTGGSLADHLGSASPEQVSEWFAQAASALAFSHERGLLHCDLKPSNILLDADGRVRLVDFGQSMHLDDKGEARLGTLGFMPPEQVLTGTRPSISWDIYALGATMYQLLTGLPPRFPKDYSERFKGLNGFNERLLEYQQILSTRVVPLWDLLPELDRDLAGIVMATLRRDSEKRTPTARTVVDDLERSRSGAPLEAFRPWKRSYLFRRWFLRNRTTVVLGLAVWLALSLPAIWLLTDFEIPIDETQELVFEYPFDWADDLPKAHILRMKPPLLSEPDFDIDENGVVDSEDERVFYSQVCLPEPNLRILTGPAVEKLLLKYSPGLGRLKNWDIEEACKDEMDWSGVTLLAARRAAVEGDQESAFRFGIGALMMEITRSKTLWSVGNVGIWAMGDSLTALDVLETLDYETLDRELLHRASQQLHKMPYPGLSQVLARKRDYIVERLQQSPTINMDEHPVLSFFRQPVSRLFEQSWNYGMDTVLRYRSQRVFEEFESRRLTTWDYWMHPIKSGAFEMMENSSPTRDWCNNKLYLDTRWSAFLLRLQLELYRKDKGAYPDSLEQLVPDYLTQLPPDPCRPEQTFLYRDKEIWSYGLGYGGSREDIESVYGFGRAWAPRLSPFSVRGAARL